MMPSDATAALDQPLTAPSVRSVPPNEALKFARNNEFQAELRRRVDEYFERTGKRRRDVPLMYFKTTTIFVLLGVAYWLLVFVAGTWWQAIPLAALVGLAVAGIGLNVQHDGSHGAYSEYNWINKAMSMCMDLIGASSYLWRYKHVLYHHTYTNVTGVDTDIELGALARVSPHQPRRAFHRFQQFYIWPLYFIMAIKWQIFDDWWEMARGTMAGHQFPRAKGWDLATFLAGKFVFLSLAFGIPMLFHPVLYVIAMYAVSAGVTGVVLAVVFQLAHCVEGAEFPMPAEGTVELENAWAIHQVITTVDFARRSRLMAWLLGGLNFQIEHHLLPRICHVNFPALSKIVEETCHKYGVKFNEHITFFDGIVSHFRWLKRMGQPDPA